MSLADLLASLAVLGLVMAATTTALDAGQRASLVAGARAEAHQNARIALERLTRDLRAAGQGLAPAFPALTATDPTRLTLQLDQDGDAQPTAPNETITWTLAATTLRRAAGAGAQPMIDNVTSLTLTYLDATNTPTTTPADVRTITITITTKGDAAPAAPAATLTTSVRLRNR